MEIHMGNEGKRGDRGKWDAAYLERHPERRAKSLTIYNNKTETKERVAKWHAENSDRVAAARKRWYEKNKEKSSENARKYAQENPEWKAAHCAKRRASKLRACPSWLTAEQLKEIESFYKEAKRLFKETEIPHHVDHIIPLQGKNVSGLHVPWNLQVLTASANSKKNNRYENS
jgi:5-methylcytosine-specific restriction endonuclease McrA